MLPVLGKTRQHCCVPCRHKKCFWSFSETFSVCDSPLVRVEVTYLLPVPGQRRPIAQFYHYTTVYVHRVHTYFWAVRAGLPTTDTKSHLSLIRLSLMSTLSSRSPTSLGDGTTKVSVLFASTLRMSIVWCSISTKWKDCFMCLGTLWADESTDCFLLGTNSV